MHLLPSLLDLVMMRIENCNPCPYLVDASVTSLATQCNAKATPFNQFCFQMSSNSDWHVEGLLAPPVPDEYSDMDGIDEDFDFSSPA
jgi:hypothetical protein